SQLLVVELEVLPNDLVFRIVEYLCNELPELDEFVRRNPDRIFLTDHVDQWDRDGMESAERKRDARWDALDSLDVYCYDPLVCVLTLEPVKIETVARHVKRSVGRTVFWILRL